MAFCVKISDATKFKGDAVLNSLGIDGRKYGRLCKSIITAANDSSITNFVNSKTNSKPGDIYLTSGGNLKAKNIIHLVTPFKKDDDGNKNLKEAYSAVINFAIEQGYKKICLPLIGTGSNGYSQSESYDAVTSACADISELEEEQDKDIIDIVVLTYLNKKNIFSKDFADEVRRERYREEVPSFKSERRIFDDGYSKVYNDPLYETIEDFCDIKPGEFFIYNRELEYYKHPFLFADDFMLQCNIPNRVLYKAGIDRKRRAQMAKQKSLKKLDIYRVSFTLGMNKTQTIEFMTICGVCFSPQYDLDMFYLKYLNGEFGKAKNFSELDDLFGKFSDEEITFNISEE